MSKSSIAYIDTSFFVHATEDPEKVMIAVHNVVPKEFSKKISLKRSNLKGEYGNPILFFKARMDEETVTESVLKHVSSQLSALDKEKLLLELSLHLEKGNLYIRLDKQAAYKGVLRLATGDPIHLRIRFRRRKKEEIIKICGDMGLLPRF